MSSLPNIYVPGNTVILRATFTDNATPPNLVDPTQLTLRVLDPTGADRDYNITELNHESVGVFNLPLYVLTSGYWNYRWEANGNMYASYESRFLVNQTVFPALATAGFILDDTLMDSPETP